MPMAEHVDYEDRYRDGFDQFRDFSERAGAVWLRYPHSSNYGVLPACLVGRVITRNRTNADVWFWNRGVFNVGILALQAG